MMKVDRDMPKQQIDTQRRVVIERVRPEINCGRFAIKRVVGETVVVEADIFADSHDQLACRVLSWQGTEQEACSSPMEPLGKDCWRGEFRVSRIGSYRYTIEGWIDRFKTWRADLVKRVAAGQDVRVELLIGAEIIADAAQRAGKDSHALREWARRLREATNQESGTSIAMEKELLPVIQRYPDPHLVSRYEKELPVVVDRLRSAVLSLVRSLSPILLNRARTSRHFPGLRGLASLHRLDGLRCGLSSAHSSDRPRISQRKEQFS